MSQNSSQPSPAEIYQGLRSQIFDVYFQTPEQAGVWGVLMEIGYPNAVVTLVALADSTASLYFSTGGGLLGAGAQEGPGKAARLLVEQATPFTAQCEQVQTYPLPAQGDTHFYLLADGKVFSVEAPEAEFGYNRQPLSPLFHLAHNLLAEMRRANPKW